MTTRSGGKLPGLQIDRRAAEVSGLIGGERLRGRDPLEQARRGRGRAGRPCARARDSEGGRRSATSWCSARPGRARRRSVPSCTVTPLTRCTAWPASLSGLFCDLLGGDRADDVGGVALLVERAVHRAALRFGGHGDLRRAAPPRSTGRCPGRPTRPPAPATPVTTFGPYPIILARSDTGPAGTRSRRYRPSTAVTVLRSDPHDLDGRTRDGTRPVALPPRARPRGRCPARTSCGAEPAQSGENQSELEQGIVWSWHRGLVETRCSASLADRPCSDEGLRFPFRRVARECNGSVTHRGAAFRDRRFTSSLQTGVRFVTGFRLLRGG